MKRYNMAIVDLSEIRNITANKETLKTAEEFLVEREIISSSGEINKARIKEINDFNANDFLTKLMRRNHRKEGYFEDTYNTLSMLNKSGEYNAMYLYIVFLYGSIEWRIPLAVNLISSNYEALKFYCKEFLKSYKSFMAEVKKNEDKEIENESE